MKRDTISELLTTAGISEPKDLLDKILAENGKDIEAEKAKLTAKENELATANNRISEMQKTIDAFGGQTPTELKTQLGNLQKKYDDDMATARKEYENLEKTHALKEALTNAGVLDADYLIYKQGGVDKFAFADKTPVGVEDIVKTYRESTPSLFATKQTTTGMSHEGGNTTADRNAEINAGLRGLVK